MSGSYLDSIPSPVARNKIDIFDSDTSEETFDSGSDDFHHVHRSISDEHLYVLHVIMFFFHWLKLRHELFFHKAVAMDTPVDLEI